MFFNNNIYFDYTAKSYAITCGVSIMNEKDFGKYWSITYEKVMQNLQSSIAGLSDEEAQKRLKEYGENTIKREKSNQAYSVFKATEKSYNAYLNFCYFSFSYYRRFD